MSKPSVDPPAPRVTLRLAPDDVEAIAQRVAELIGPRARIGLVDVDEICRRFRVSRTWVYEHARELGAIPLGQTGGGPAAAPQVRPRASDAGDRADERGA